MLSDKERILVKECMQNYPAGVPTTAWGYGIMQENRYSLPNNFTLKELKKYGWPAVRLAVARGNSDGYLNAIDDISNAVELMRCDYTEELSKDPKALAEKL